VYHAQLADRSTVVPSSSTPADPVFGTDTVMPDLTSTLTTSLVDSVSADVIPGFTSESPSTSSDADDSMTLVKIISHTGSNLRTAEYLCQYSDGETVYQHYPDLAGDPVYEAYCS